MHQGLPVGTLLEVLATAALAQRGTQDLSLQGQGMEAQSYALQDGDNSGALTETQVLSKEGRKKRPQSYLVTFTVVL